MSKVLIIEDELDVQKLYRDMLLDAGFEVDVASDGVEGLSKAREGGYNLILLDIVMPKLDGMGVLEGLKVSPPLQKNGPIVVLTNVDEDTSVKKALELGVRGYIVKANVNPEQFVFEVKNYLRA